MTMINVRRAAAGAGGAHHSAQHQHGTGFMNNVARLRRQWCAAAQLQGLKTCGD